MRVDVILPTWDGARFVSEALESVLAQTHQDWHLTAIDDGSRDETVDCLEAFGRCHPGRLSLIRNDHTLRAAASRMKAIQATDAELIAFLDQDDRWLPTKLERQIERLRSDVSVAALHGDVEHIDARGERLAGSADAENAQRRVIGFDGLDRRQACRALFRRNSIRLVSAVVRRRAFLASGGFRGELFGGEDWEFWVRFASRFRVAHLPEVVVERRLHAENTSTSRALERTTGLLEALSILEREEPGVADLCPAKRLELGGRLVLESSQAERYRDAAHAACRMLRSAPWCPVLAAYLGVGLSGPIGRRWVAARRRRLKRGAAPAGEV